MTKNFIVLVLVAGISSMVWAANGKRGTASKTDPIKGLNCALEYKPIGGLLFDKTSDDSGHWILGEKSTATLTDSIKGAVVTIEALENKKKDFFRVKITQKQQELVNVTSEWKGMQITIPVKVTSPESEDPTTYDQLRVTCETTYLAG